MNPHNVDQCITFLPTIDLNATARFYEQMLGLPLARDQGDCRIYRVSRDGYIGFCRRVNALAQPGSVILTLVTDEVDKWYRRLCEQGIEFDKPLTLNEKYGIYHCFLRDPNGYLIEIQRFIQPLE